MRIFECAPPSCSKLIHYHGIRISPFEIWAIPTLMLLLALHPCFQHAEDKPNYPNGGKMKISIMVGAVLVERLYERVDITGKW